MKERELRQHVNCSLCRKPVVHTGLPLFWRVTVERFGIDAEAVQRNHGLMKFLGSARLATAIGPDEDMAKPVMEKAVLTLCESCAMEHGQLVDAAMQGTPAPIGSNG